MDRKKITASNLLQSLGVTRDYVVAPGLRRPNGATTCLEWPVQPEDITTFNFFSLPKLGARKKTRSFLVCLTLETFRVPHREKVREIWNTLSRQVRKTCIQLLRQKENVTAVTCPLIGHVKAVPSVTKQTFGLLSRSLDQFTERDSCPSLSCSPVCEVIESFTRQQPVNLRIQPHKYISSPW